MLREALSIYRTRFVALVLTCALALIPANLLMAGTVLFGLAGISAIGLGEASAPPSHDVRGASPDDRGARLQQLGKEAQEGGGPASEEALHRALPIAYAVVVAVAILLAGIALAHAAVVPLVLGSARGPAAAWAAVAARLGVLGRTAIVEVPLVALGALLCILPGIAMAVGFSLAIPAAMTEGSGGRAALERSWTLLRGRWAQALGIWVLIALFTVAASAIATLPPPGPWRAVVSGAVRLVTYPFPLVALVLLYQRAVREEGQGAEKAPQYIRRISAPG